MLLQLSCFLVAWVEDVLDKTSDALPQLFYHGIQPSSWILALQVKILFGFLRFGQKFAKKIFGLGIGQLLSR